MIGIIPARLESTRLPRKMLLNATGKPLIQHTWEQAMKAKSLDKVIVATDSEEIHCACIGFGAVCIRTGEHPNGTSRCAEVAERLLTNGVVDRYTTIVNIQGDEPEIDPDHIDRVADACYTESMATLATPFDETLALLRPSTVKVVLNEVGEAMYFSRAPIPYVRDSKEATREYFLRHIGLYAYPVHVLLRLAKSPPCHLENIERLEQLRALHLRIKMKVGIVECALPGIDTQDEYNAFVARRMDEETIPA